MVVRQEPPNTVYRFLVRGSWSDTEWKYNEAMHEHKGIRLLLGGSTLRRPPAPAPAPAPSPAAVAAATALERLADAAAARSGEMVEQLRSMGFDADEAATALQLCDNRLDQACALLTDWAAVREPPASGSGGDPSLGLVRTASAEERRRRQAAEAATRDAEREEAEAGAELAAVQVELDAATATDVHGAPPAPTWGGLPRSEFERRLGQLVLRFAKSAAQRQRVPLQTVRRHLEASGGHVGRAALSLQAMQEDAFEMVPAESAPGEMTRAGWLLNAGGAAPLVMGRVTDHRTGITDEGVVVAPPPLGALPAALGPRLLQLEVVQRRLALAKAMQERLAEHSPANELDLDTIEAIGQLLTSTEKFTRASGGVAIGDHGAMAVVASNSGTGCAMTGPEPMRQGVHRIQLQVLSLALPEPASRAKPAWRPDHTAHPYSVVVGVMQADRSWKYGWPAGWGLNIRNAKVIHNSTSSLHAWSGSCEYERESRQHAEWRPWAGSGDVLTLELDVRGDGTGSLSVGLNGAPMATACNFSGVAWRQAAKAGFCWAVQLGYNMSRDGVRDGVRIL